MLRDLISPINVISIAIGLIGLAIGISQLPTFSDINRISYVYTVHEVKLPNAERELQITYNGERIESRNINIFYFSFWNSGTNSLEKRNMRQRLSIYTTDAREILSCEVKERSPGIIYVTNEILLDLGVEPSQKAADRPAQ